MAATATTMSKLMQSVPLTHEVVDGIVNSDGRKYASPNGVETFENIQNSYKQLVDNLGAVVLSISNNDTSNIMAEATYYKVGIELLFRKLMKRTGIITGFSKVNATEFHDLKLMQLNLSVLWNHIDGLLPFKGGTKNKSKTSRRHTKNKKSRRH